MAAKMLVARFATSSVFQKAAEKEKVIILGAAGRDFHDFLTYWSKQPNVEVKCFTETQIPGIDNRHFPAEMCNNHLNDNLYKNGLDIYPEASLEELIKRFEADTCSLAYSDLPYDTVQSLASRVNAAGCKFVQLSPKMTQVESSKPVVAVVASRTGVGKSQTTRYVANYYKNKGLKVAVARHPMPYDSDINSQRCQRYEVMEDMDKYRCTIEEREEYFRHIEDGNLLFAGVDYEMILRQAEKEADIVIWDGGNNDCSFFKPDLTITLVDSLRPTDELHYYPGETNVRMADAVLVTKTNELKDMQHAHDHAAHLKTLVNSPVFFGKSVILPEAAGLRQSEAIRLVEGKRVLVVDDGPTLTHGGLPFGAGYSMAVKFGASEIVDPKPFAKGSIKGVFEKFTHLEKVLPAMGYGDEQIKDLEDTINAVDCDSVVIGTPSDISHVMDIYHPSVVARYDLELVPEHVDEFHSMLDSCLDKYEAHHDAA